MPDPYECKKPSQLEFLAYTLTAAASAFGGLVAILATLWYFESQIDELERRLMESVAPISMDAPR
jgi:hypothetical protein